MRTKHDWIVCLFICPYNPKWSIDDAPDKYIMGTLCLLFISKHMSVSLLFVNKQTVSWSFVCQYIIDMLFAPSHDDNEQFVKFHHYTLGSHVTSLEWVTCYPLHFTLVYIVYRESRIRQVVYHTYMYIMASTVKCTLELTVIWLICHLLHYLFSN